jgi:hypothetical protein
MRIRTAFAKVCFRITESNLVAVGFVAAVLTAVILWRVEPLTPGHPDFDRPWDHHKYRHMATTNLTDFHIAPFCGRIGVPFLARSLPVDSQTGFMVVALVSVMLTGVAVFGLARAARYTREEAWAAMFLFYGVGYATRHFIERFWLPDAASMLFLALVLLAILRRNDAAFALLLALGVTVKENILFAAPLYYTLTTRRLFDRRLLVRTAALAAPAIGVLLVLRLTIAAYNSDPDYVSLLPQTLWQVQSGTPDYNYHELIFRVGSERLQALSPGYAASLYLRPFGVLVSLLPVLALRCNLRLYLRLAPFILLLYAQLLFAVSTERLLAFGAPVLILPALAGLRSLGCRLRVRIAGVLPLLVLTWGVNQLDTERQAARFVYQLLGVVLYLSILGLMKRRRSNRAPVDAAPPPPPVTARAGRCRTGGTFLP